MRIELQLEHETTERIVRTELGVYRPPPEQTASQWADEERYLSPESCPEPGKWHTSRVEYMRGFMDACSDPEIPEVIGLFGAQMAKTDAVLNVCGFHIQVDPAPILMIQPDLKLAEAWSKDRLAPMLRDTPSLRGLVEDARDSGNTILHKTFPGGHITVTGANSPASLAMRPIRIVIGDEIDNYGVSAGQEGSPLELAGTRTVAFWNAKKIWITTPRNKGSSLSEKIWEKSDQRRYFVPCHDCGHEQYLKWAQIQWDKDPETGEHLTDTARYVCERCGAWWDDVQRWAAISVGRWIATKPFRGVAGFHLPAFAAPWESRTMAAIAKKFREARRAPHLFKVFVNTIWCDWYEEKYSALNSDRVQSRKEPYPERDGQVLVPRGVGLVTAGVDVQDDRIEVQIQGYGASWEQWKLQYHVLYGDPSAPALWDGLWELLCRPLPGEDGLPHYIRATAVDTGGHHTLRAYEFCRPRYRMRMADGLTSFCFAIKGKGGQGGKFWPVIPSTKNKGKVPLFIVMVDHAKEVLYTALDRIKEAGPGFIHFPMSVSAGQPFDERYFAQLTSEKVVDRNSPNGETMRVWELKVDGGRNEALDTSVYGHAALHGLMGMGVDVERKTEERAALALASAGHVPPTAPPVASAPAERRPATAGPTAPPPQRRVGRSRWMERD